MKAPLLALLVAAVALVAPVAAQDEPASHPAQAFMDDSYELGRLTFTVGPRMTEWAWENLELGPKGSQVVRHTIDGIETGESDGEVTPEEAAAAEAFLQRMAERALKEVEAENRLSDVVVMDDHAEITQIAVTRLEHEGIVGPVESEEHVTLDLFGLIKFNTRRSEVHTIQVNIGNFRLSDDAVTQTEKVLGDFQLVIRPEETWRIDPTSIQPDCAAEKHDVVSDEMVFVAKDLECFRERGGNLIAFSILGVDRAPGGFAPGFEAVLVALALFAGVAAVRRRL